MSQRRNRVEGLPSKHNMINSSSHALMLTDSGIKDANRNDPNYSFGLGTQQQWQ